MNAISAFIEGTPESSVTLLSMGGQSKKMAICQPGGRLSPDTKCA